MVPLHVEEVCSAAVTARSHRDPHSANTVVALLLAIRPHRKASGHKQRSMHPWIYLLLRHQPSYYCLYCTCPLLADRGGRPWLLNQAEDDIDGVGKQGAGERVRELQ